MPVTHARVRIANFEYRLIKARKKQRRNRSSAVLLALISFQDPRLLIQQRHNDRNRDKWTSYTPQRSRHVITMTKLTVNFSLSHLLFEATIEEDYRCNFILGTLIAAFSETYTYRLNGKQVAYLTTGYAAFPLYPSFSDSRKSFCRFLTFMSKIDLFLRPLVKKTRER